MIIISPNEKLYVCVYPNPNTVIKHFLDKENPVIDAETRKQDEGVVKTLASTWGNWRTVEKRE